MKRLLIGCVVAVLLLSVLSNFGWAQPKTDSFSVMLEGDNDFLWGSGSGWQNQQSGEQWFYYDQTDTDWWNQWFYDDPPNDERWKHIDYDMDIVIDPYQLGLEIEHFRSFVEVAINWSTMEYSPPIGTGPNGPPPMPSDEAYIERKVVYSQEHTAGGSPLNPIVIPVTGGFDISEYNPEWVSVDVRVDSWQTVITPGMPEDPVGVIETWPLLVDVSGTITHECIPEPSSIILLLTGAFGLLLRIRRRR